MSNIVMIGLFSFIPLILLFSLIVLALVKYLRTKPMAPQPTAVQKSLAEALKSHRINAQMTQEFVAEALGVSRQAVSKWENGTSDPSTSNLLALAKLYGISASELLDSMK